VQKPIILIMLLLLLSTLIHPLTWNNKPEGNLSIRNDSLDGFQKLYKSLNDSGISFEAFSLAMKGYQTLSAKGLVKNDSVLTIIDYSRPSSDNRFYVINLRQKDVLFKTLVAHGRNSGDLYASKFSNKAQSYQSALGFYLTGSAYEGGNGYSMLLNGVDTGYNDFSRVRSIVVHGAKYVTRAYIDRYGRLGRSFGCPALSPEVNATIINLIKEGSVLFSYYPDNKYLKYSKVLGSLSAKKSSTSHGS
jgi:hypothetical protein